MAAIDDVIKKYSDELQRIYDNRTAGSHTFTGVLGKFLTEASTAAQEILAAPEIKLNPKFWICENIGHHIAGTIRHTFEECSMDTQE